MKLAAVRIGMIGVAAIPTLAIVGVAVAAAVWLAFARAALPPIPTTPAPAAQPRLEVGSGGDLAAVQRRAQRRLSDYGWNDPGRTRAHIPLQRAMALTAQRGWRDPEPAR